MQRMRKTIVLFLCLMMFLCLAPTAIANGSDLAEMIDAAIAAGQTEIRVGDATVSRNVTIPGDSMSMGTAMRKP